MKIINPPYEITDKMLNFVASISAKAEKITLGQEFKTKPHLRRNNKIKSIHSSLKIEANSLSLSDVRDVINGNIVLGSKKEIQEVKNAYDAYEEIGKFSPYSITDYKKLHGIMTKYVVEESGDFRKGEEGVFDNNDRCIFVAPPAKFVSELMWNLFQWINEAREKVHPLILSCVFHYEMVFVHPFADGNGRMARLWHTAFLYEWKNIFEFIPIESQIEKCQDGYYKAIADCHLQGKSNIFIEFMLEQIDACLDEIIKQTSFKGGTQTDYVKNLISVMDYDVAYSANDILLLLDLKSRETLRKNYLNPAIESGLVKMTVPDKPNSKNQRYIKV